MNKLIILIIFLILIMICKNNIKEKFSNIGSTIWSCQNNENGYCYNISRFNFNKSDWKSPDWNNSFNSVDAKLKTVYHNPAYSYPECEDWLKDPVNVEISEECLKKINKKLIKKEGSRMVVDDSEDEDGNKRAVIVEKKSGGFAQYCSNRDKNYHDCDKYNYHSGDKKFIGFGNDEDKTEDDRKKDFLKFCRRLNDKVDQQYWKDLRDGKIIPANINRFEPSDDAGSFPTKKIEVEPCVKLLCNSDNKCKFDNNKNICRRDYNQNKIQKYVRSYRCNDSNNQLDPYFEDIFNLQEKIKNKDVKNTAGLEWNSDPNTHIKNNIYIK
mgnify:FL=1